MAAQIHAGISSKSVFAPVLAYVGVTEIVMPGQSNNNNSGYFYCFFKFIFISLTRVSTQCFMRVDNGVYCIAHFIKENGRFRTLASILIQSLA